MRRTLLALVLVCGFGLPLAMFTTAHAEETTPIVVTVHLASCPIEAVNSDVGFYDACHANGIAAGTLIFAGLETDPVAFTTDESGVGVVVIDSGLTSVSQVTLSADEALTGSARSYVYCADQVDGSVIFNYAVEPGGSVPLFTVDGRQEIICDWYVYTDSAVDDVPVG